MEGKGVQEKRVSAASHKARLDEWCASRGAAPCACGGGVAAGHTVPRLVVRSDDMAWEALAHANCERCGAGEQVAVVEVEESGVLGLR